MESEGQVPGPSGIKHGCRVCSRELPLFCCSCTVGCLGHCHLLKVRAFRHLNEHVLDSFVVEILFMRRD